MWRGKDVLTNVLGYLVFGVPIKMHPIVYRKPRGGLSPPRPPRWWGGNAAPPPQTSPLAAHTYQTYELLAKAHGVGVVASKCWWDSCGENATMNYIKHNASRVGYTLRTEFQKMEIGKSHNVNGLKTIGSVCNVILMKSCHERIEGICHVWSCKWIPCCCIHMIV